MPKSAPSSYSKSLRYRFRARLLKFFLPWACLGFLVFALFKKSESLVTSKSKENKEIASQNSLERKEHNTPENTPEKKVKKPKPNLPVASKYEEWCETGKYQDYPDIAPSSPLRTGSMHLKHFNALKKRTVNMIQE